MDGLPRAEPLGKVTPLHAGPHPVQDPVDHLPVVPPSATTSVTHRQERLQPLPLTVGQIPTTSHIKLTGHMIGEAWLGAGQVAPERIGAV